MMRKGHRRTQSAAINNSNFTYVPGPDVSSQNIHDLLKKSEEKVPDKIVTL